MGRDMMGRGRDRSDQMAELTGKRSGNNVPLDNRGSTGMLQRDESWFDGSCDYLLVVNGARGDRRTR